MGDDIGLANVSAYSMGLMGYRAPNIPNSHSKIVFIEGLSKAQKISLAGPGA